MKKIYLSLLIIFLILWGFLFFLNTKQTIGKITTTYNQIENKENQTQEEFIKDEKKPLKTPEKVKGIYMTGYVFSNQILREKLIKLIKETELNSVVIDIKDAQGRIMFKPKSNELKDWPQSPALINYDEYQKKLTELQSENIYTIARITTFQDPEPAKKFNQLTLKTKTGGVWYDYRGLNWFDMTNQGVWDLIIKQTEEAYLIGFDEVQFDYIRFPSDGNLKTIQYKNLKTGQKKYELMNDFYKYLSSGLSDIKIPLSIDLFGLTYWQRDDENYDLGIGQKLTDVGKYFDYISPMLYPSHYYSGVMGFNNPAQHPYEIINKSLKDGIVILTKSSSTALTRPWIQDFDLGANYDASMIKKQIQACDDNNCSGWLLWNASNKYTESALKKELDK